MSEPAPSRLLRGEDVLRDPLVSELVDARLVGVLCTFDLDGPVHAVPLWYAALDGALVFATSSRSRKVRNLAADPRATVVLHDSRPGYEVCGASISGTVEIVRPPEAQALVDLVHARYLAAETETNPAARAYLESDDVALRFMPSAAVTWDERGSSASRVVRERGWALPLESTDPRV
jgi:PPOX class probable F420-dependent enzyme